MYIKCITIEGFKSYGNRTIISGFDPSFNAITGLNGSGKSNILDSICFVLGITNLSQVRATNLNELVYKNGQAGINKATVTVTFDNSDKKASPLGYDGQREISVTRTVVTGGKNKYFINGVGANNNRVHDLFQSVQLNVNNPHFLIMQGRITKVLNMKPLEILSMIEEAAGTRMYEDKKEVALKSLEKKESRLREIQTMLSEHICPQLEKLKEERKEYTEYTRVTRDLEKLSKLYTAWDYTKTEELIQSSEGQVDKLKKDSEEHKASIVEMKQKIADADNRIIEIEKKMDVDGGNKLKTLEDELKKVQVSETKADTYNRNLKDALKEDIKKNAELVKNLKEEKTTLTLKERELQNSLKKLEALKSEADKEKDEIAAAENHFHAVNAGLSGEDGEEASLAAQLITANKDKKDAETEAKSIEMSLKHMKAELDKKQTEIKKVDKSYSQDMATHKALENEVNKIKNEISKLNYEDGSYENLVAEERNCSNQIERLRDQLDGVFARHPQLSFDYVDPVKDFDRKKVFGPLCLQIDIVDPKYAVALDLAAGGKLYQIIVDNEQTGKLLLDKGQLRRRCTMIPLNKIRSQCIDNRTVAEAERLVGKENVTPALSCVRFDKRLSPAMEYAFGNTFICANMEVAKKVTFANNIRKRSVTLEGEVFDPSGTLSGGSMGNKGKLLAELSPVAKMKTTIALKQNQLTEIQTKIRQLQKVKERYDYLCEQCELKENEARLLKSKIEHSNHHKQLEELQKLQESLAEQKALLAECGVKQKKAEKLIKELEAKTSKSTREAKIKEAEKAVANCKKKAAASQEKYNTFFAEVNGLKLEIEGIIESLPELEGSIQTSNTSIEALQKKLEEHDSERNKIKESVANMAAEVKSHKEMMKSHSSEITKISKEKEQLNKKIANAELQIQQLEHDIKNSKDNVGDAVKKMKYLLDKHKWIESQKRYFGVANSEYDFDSFNPKQSHLQIKHLEEMKEKLQRNVNMRAQNMLASVEEQYKNLVRKREIVLKDKMVIEGVIKTLDEQTKTALKNACEQVNRDFGSIFRTLLPGTNAKLVPQQGKTVLDGLEFKVAFGDVWKESLNELSGGQRSLVALSLILALLLFNPAPIYILDEVDAALDLSHTQNIGKMLKMHFQKSQFIIVSLKDGMFNNANVLFRTKFSDGMSSVTRTTQSAR